MTQNKTENFKTKINLPIFFYFYFNTNNFAGSAIECWDCKSDVDGRCNDPFNNRTGGVVTTNCLEARHDSFVKSFRCRKILVPRK